MNYIEFGITGGTTGGKKYNRIYEDGTLTSVIKLTYASLHPMLKILSKK